VNHLHTEILYDTEDIRAAVDKAMGSPASNPPNFPLPPFPTCLHVEKLYMYCTGYRTPRVGAFPSCWTLHARAMT
jgi:hypothetical protein